jgi:hypothetical protein
VALQRLADHIGLRLSICHFPPGTSKWNKIETSYVLSYHRELAWKAADQRGCDFQQIMAKAVSLHPKVCTAGSIGLQ